MCQCDNCHMPTSIESICCCEMDKVAQKKGQNNTPVNCITEHDGFNSVCLNVWVLQAAYYSYRQDYGGSSSPSSIQENNKITSL